MSAAFFATLVLICGEIVFSPQVSAQTVTGRQKLGPVPADQRGPQARTTRGRALAEQPSPFLDAVSFAEKRQRTLSANGRIVGGQPAPAAAYPWMVSIGLAGKPFSEGHFCGGAFVSPGLIITAAHCFGGVRNPQQIQIKYGTNVLSSGGTVADVKAFKLHPAWNPLTFENDVAVIELAKPAQDITPIKLVDPKTIDDLFFDGVLAVVAGWGLTEESGGEVSDVLRHVGVQVVSNGTCNAPQSYAGDIKESMFCAGFVAGMRDSCQGDSGGPFMAFDGKGGYMLVGVVSWGEGCARPNKYGVYTRIATHLDWINMQLQ